jgi:hypothetical protein
MLRGMARFTRVSRALPAAALGAALLATAAPAAANTPYIMPILTVDQELGAEFQFGQRSAPGDDITALTLVGTFRQPLGPQFALIAELGLGHAEAGDFDGTTLSNFTVGGTYMLSRGGGRRTGLSFSLSLPTASDDGDDGGAAGFLSGFYLADPGRFAPDATTFRAYLDYRLDSGRVFAQIEGGLQAIFRDGEDWVLLRGNLAAGVGLSPRISIVGELTNMAYIFVDDEPNDEDFLHALDIGMRFRLSNGRLGARVYIPLDDSRRDADDLGIALDFTILL